MVMNKKGQELTLGTIILIVLGVVVLVFLIYGFSTGWGNLWQRLTGLGGGKVNVDTIRTACDLACSRGDNGIYSYCQEKQNVILDGGWKGSWSCKNLETQQAFQKGTETKLETILLNKCATINCTE
jgi:hypothetical protein